MSRRLAMSSAANRALNPLSSRAFIEPTTRRLVAGNSLVLIVPADSKVPLDGFRSLASPQIKKLSIGQPKTVPAGDYAQQALKHLDLLESVKDRKTRDAVKSVLEAKQTGEEKLRQVHLDLLFKQQFGNQPGPYERLLADALAGNQQRFAREDSVIETWRIVQPLLDKPCDIETYEPGTWGPESASQLLHGYGGWRRPWLPQAPLEAVGV